MRSWYLDCQYIVCGALDDGEEPIGDCKGVKLSREMTRVKKGQSM